MLKPPLLQNGDRVAIVAPARKINSEQVDGAVKILEQYGLQVVLSQNLYTNSHSYLAATDDQRFADLQHCLDDTSLKAVICARGGYGSTRILDRLDFQTFFKSPKWLIGFSDVTAIHLKLLREKVMSIHGTMPILFTRPDAVPSVDSLMKVLTEGRFAIEAPVNNSNRLGTSQGQLVGGNLSLIVDSLGTPSEIDTENCILVLEEIDEYFYRIDRMMTQLKRAGKLKNLKGIIIGHMTDIKESELPFGESIEQIVLDKVKDYQYPVAFGFPTGHQNPNLAWIHGEIASLIVAKNGSQLSAEVSA